MWLIRIKGNEFMPVLITLLFLFLQLKSLSEAGLPSLLLLGEEHILMNTRSTLVIYSGPTSLNATDEFPKVGLYLLNFQYFLRHGVQCSNSANIDTVIVTTKSVAEAFHSQLRELSERCSLKVLLREDTCLDMESMRVVLTSSQLNLAIYDYYVFVNCGVSGPQLPVSELHVDDDTRSAMKQSLRPWTHYLTDLLSKEVKMAGLSINCFAWRQHAPHVQSFVYALDKQGLQIIRDAECVFDCRHFNKNRTQIILRYEVGMSQAILAAHYSIADYLTNTTISSKDLETCQHLDMWKQHLLQERFGFGCCSLEQTLFFKSSRFVPPQVAKQINYTGSSLE
jgi:hypothetical protein